MSDIVKKAELERAHQEVLRVLAFGQVKYPDNKWKRQSLETVMEHALGHEELVEVGSPVDDESGCHNLAHGIVRRMMALQKLLDKQDEEGRRTEER